MTRGTDLYRLQCLDSEKEAKQQRLVEVEAALEDDSALQRASRVLESAKERAQQLTIQQRDQELEIEGLSDRISRSEQRLYSGKVKNPKELSDLQKEVASLKRRRQGLEDRLLETMIEREEAEGDREQAQAHLGEIESHWAAEQADLRTERDELRARLEEIEEEREALLPRIKAGDLANYEALRERKNGQAVARVRDGACGACGVTISPSVEWQLRQGELVQCDNCRRIVVTAR